MKKRDWRKVFRKDNAVFLVSAGISLVIAAWGIFGSESAAVVANAAMGGLKANFSWAYLAIMLGFVLFSLFVAFSPWGRIRLGNDDDKPEHSTVSWFAMLFGAGMGVGLVFWGTAEPLSHYVAPMGGIEGQTAEAAAFAIRSSFMHWGLHPWACYVVLGLGLAYFMYRKKRPAMVSNLLSPLWRKGKNPPKVLNAAIDVYTTVLTTVGVATSFGMGCLQISEGLNYLFGVPNDVYLWLALIVVIAFIYLKTAISGIDKGIKLLSDINMVLFVALMIAVYLIGPTGVDFRLMIAGVIDYIANFIPDSLRLAAPDGTVDWIQGWRVFYWAWWLSWAPFVGFFIARISKGRTIRQFICGALIVPTVVGIFWFAAFGGMTLNVADGFSPDQLSALIASPETVLFHIYNEYQPFAMALSLISMCLLGTFFITSANSATFVLAMLTSDGELDPPAGKKIFWGLLIAFVALALILSGGISMIQTISIVIAFPYLFFLVLVCVCIVIVLRRDTRRRKAPAEAVTADATEKQVETMDGPDGVPGCSGEPLVEDADVT